MAQPYEMDRAKMLEMIHEYNRGAATAYLATRYEIPRSFCRATIATARGLGLVRDKQRDRIINAARARTARKVARESRVYDGMARGQIISDDKLSAIYGGRNYENIEQHTARERDLDLLMIRRKLSGGPIHKAVSGPVAVKGIGWSGRE